MTIEFLGVTIKTVHESGTDKALLVVTRNQVVFLEGMLGKFLDNDTTLDRCVLSAFLASRDEAKIEAANMMRKDLQVLLEEWEG